MRELTEEYLLQGTPVSEGIAIGIPFFFDSFEEEAIPEFSIASSKVEDEVARYRKAVFSSREDLERLQSDLAIEGSMDAMTIIDTHIQMLEDPLMTTDMEEKIRKMHRNTETVFRSAMSEYEIRLSQASDTIFRQRMVDVMDVSRRILGHLRPVKRGAPSDIPPNSIVFAHELLPSDTAAVHASRVSGFVIEIGGGNSHAALIARDKGIPVVAGIQIEHLQQARGQVVIVDGMKGEVVVNPSLETLEKYKKRRQQLKTHYKRLEKELPLPSETLDGRHIHLYANAGSVDDLEHVHQVGAAGVGLFRTEYLTLQNQTLFFSEEEQFSTYLKIIQMAKGKPITMRLFDIGGDKRPDLFEDLAREPNPVLGCRGIRFLLRKKELLKTQLRALLRASPYGDLRLLLPLISDITELREAKRIIQEVAGELAMNEVAIKEKIPVGCMIEVPSALLLCDALAEECDFLSIGTNDLVQYTLGIDRSNPLMNNLYFPAHPSIIRMIRLAVTEAQKAKKPVAICGEISSNPLFTPLLIGLGIEELSCAPRYLPVIKQVIRKWKFKDAAALADKILRLKTASEVTQLLLDAHRKT